MNRRDPNPSSLRIGFVITRFHGTDGVSLETRKWLHVLEQGGHECFFFTGEADYAPDHCRMVDEAHFEHPEIQAINDKLFVHKQRDEQVSRSIGTMKEHLENQLRQFIDDFELDLIIAENAWALPMNLPLGLALTEVVAERRMPAIGHHHDFWWERQRFRGSPAEDYLDGCFPPDLSCIQHVVINSVAGRQLAFRKGCKSQLIPNVMDFGTPPEAPGDYAADLRSEVGIGDEDWLLLQPTRVVPRKRIELSIDVARALGDRCVVLVTHESGDEGGEYLEYLQEYARVCSVRLIAAADRFGRQRGRTGDDRKVYSLADAYHAADIVTYPSQLEGFGNAFLETIYYRKPIVINAYEIFMLDISPKGFKALCIDEFVRPDLAARIREILDDPQQVSDWVDRNYELGELFYSFGSLRKKLDSVLDEPFGDGGSKL